MNSIHSVSSLACRRGIGLIAVVLVVSFLNPVPSSTDEGSDTSSTEAKLGACGGVITHIVSVAPRPPRIPSDFREVFEINPIYAVDITAEEEAVIAHAILEWEGIILTNGYRFNPLSITFNHEPQDPSLAYADVWTEEGTGDILSAAIHFDDDADFYVDPTPANNNDDVFGNYDLLTVARHEIGHAVGWLQALDFPMGGSLHVANLFDGCCNLDPDRVNIATIVNDAAHANGTIHHEDLMQPNQAPGERRPISMYPDAAYVARAFNCDVSMQFVDASYTGAETGSANQPWITFSDGVINTPPGWMLLLIKGNYDLTAALTISSEMTIRTARGGNAAVE